MITAGNLRSINITTAMSVCLSVLYFYTRWTFGCRFVITLTSNWHHKLRAVIKSVSAFTWQLVFFCKLFIVVIWPYRTHWSDSLKIGLIVIVLGSYPLHPVCVENFLLIIMFNFTASCPVQLQPLIRAYFTTTFDHTRSKIANVWEISQKLTPKLLQNTL